MAQVPQLISTNQVRGLPEEIEKLGDLQAQVDAIESKSDVVDIVDTYAKLQAYDTAPLGDNDVIKVLTDEEHGNAISYYRWNKADGEWKYIGSIGPYYTKSETDDEIRDALDNYYDKDETDSRISQAVNGIQPSDKVTNLPKYVAGGNHPGKIIQEFAQTADVVIPKVNHINLEDPDASGLTAQIGRISAATKDQAGVMSAKDKETLDRLASGDAVKLYDAYSTKTDGSNTAKFINDTFNVDRVSIGEGSETTRDAEISIGKEGAPRFLANVKNAEEDTDAPNYGQVKNYIDTRLWTIIEQQTVPEIVAGDGYPMTEQTRNAFMERIYPIGAIYYTTEQSSAEAVSEAMGFGTWVAWGSGRVPVGYSQSETEFNQIEKTGGEKSHTLSAEEMPQHRHGVGSRGSSGSLAAAGSSIGREFLGTATYGDFFTGTMGGSAAHNNLQPYITVYMWKRTS